MAVELRENQEDECMPSGQPKASNGPEHNCTCFDSYSDISCERLTNFQTVGEDCSVVGWGGARSGNTEHTLLLMEQRCAHIAKDVIRAVEERPQSQHKDKATGIHLTQPMGNNRFFGET